MDMLIPNLEKPGNNPASEKLTLDISAHQVTLGDRELCLTVKEFDLLLFFTNNRNRAVSRSQIIKEVWANDPLETDRTVDIHVCRLRKKLGADPNVPQRIVTLTKIGYRFKG